jgi:TolB-like protein
MKKFFIVLLCCLVAAGAFAQTISLDEAIRSAASEMGQRLPQGGKVAVLSFTSMSDQLSAYVIDELNNAIVNVGTLTVVDRQQLDLIMQEMQFQESGLVSDESAQEIGRMLGAQYIVSGSIEVVAGSYRFRTRALTVENAAIVYSSSQSVANDRIIASLTGRGEEIAGDYTAAERNRARMLNILFGIGSFSQQDYRGGTLTAVMEIGGLASLGVGLVFLATAPKEVPPIYAETDQWGQLRYYYFNGEGYGTKPGVDAAVDDFIREMDAKRTTGIILTAAGGVLFTGGIIYGLIRPSFTHRPGYVANAPTNLANWNLALVSNSQGNPAFRLAYKMSF